MTRKTYASKKRPSPNPRMADEAPMRLKHLRITGMRTLDDVKLDLNGLTVLIGDNGSGKSSILEACEILRRAATAPDFSVEFGEIHGGISEIRRSGQPAVQLLAALSNGRQYAEYQIVLGAGGILRESLSRAGRHQGGRPSTIGDARYATSQVAPPFRWPSAKRMRHGSACHRAVRGR